jgi:hypothetical protein
MPHSNSTVITVPAQPQLEQALAQFHNEWGLVDEVLYRLCREHPGHDSARTAIGKVALIGRAYAAGLERQVRVNGNEQAVVKVGTFLHEHGERVDEIIAPLGGLDEPLDTGKARLIVEQHGLLTSLLKQVTRANGSSTRSARSFASKYLHFHCPLVPIYDQYVRSTIPGLVRWSGEQVPFAQPDVGDREYWTYVVYFLRLYEASAQTGVKPSVKGLDSWLWSLNAVEARP